MKKAFLAVITALSLAGFSYAQDDDYEEEVVYEDEAPAAPAAKPAPKKQKVVYEEVEEDEDEAPAAKPAKKAKKASGDAFIGIGIDLTEALNDNSRISVAFKLNPSMELSAILGFYHHGETTVEAGGMESKQGDNYTALAIGAEFDYYLPTPFLPTSIGGKFIYNSLGEDTDALEFGVVFGVHAELTKNLVLSGGVGLDFYYWMESQGDADASRMDFGLNPTVKLTWYAF